MNVANDTPTGTADFATTAAVVSSCVVMAYLFGGTERYGLPSF